VTSDGPAAERSGSTMSWLRRPSRDEAEEAEWDFTAAIYGSLLVTTLVAVQWHGDAAPELIGLSLLVSTGIFWLTHVWSGVMNRRVRGRVTPAEALWIAREEAPMLLAAIIPALALGLPRFVGLDVDTAIGLALVISLAQLFLWGLAVGRAAHDRWWLSLLIALVDLGLGMVIVVAKVAVLH
jgi:hypothetical protein